MSEQLLNKILDKLDSMDNRLGRVEDRLSNLEGQMSETNGIAKALLHQSETQKARMH